MSQTALRPNLRILSLALLWSLGLLVCWPQLAATLRLSLSDHRYSHIVLIPVISAFFVIATRRRGPVRSASWAAGGVPLLAGAVGLYGMGRWYGAAWEQSAALAITMAAAVLFWIGAFWLCRGKEAFRRLMFPLWFLLFMVPVPSFWLEKIIGFLRYGSAEASYALFQLSGESVFRQGFVFSLSSITIHIADECSSIRSSQSLAIVGVLAGRLFLRGSWGRLCLGLVTVPIAMFTNAVRIVTLSLLSIYVDAGFLDGDLHHRGGVLFALISVSLLCGIAFLLRNSELRRRRTAPAADAAPADTLVGGAS